MGDRMNSSTNLIITSLFFNYFTKVLVSQTILHKECTSLHVTFREQIIQGKMITNVNLITSKFQMRRNTPTYF